MNAIILNSIIILILGLPGGSAVENPPANTGGAECEFNPWVGKIPWRREWQPTPVVLLGNSHGQEVQEGYSPWGCKRVRHELATGQQQQ